MYVLLLVINTCTYISRVPEAPTDPNKKWPSLLVESCHGGSGLTQPELQFWLKCVIPTVVKYRDTWYGGHVVHPSKVSNKREFANICGVCISLIKLRVLSKGMKIYVNYGSSEKELRRDHKYESMSRSNS